MSARTLTIWAIATALMLAGVDRAAPCQPEPSLDEILDRFAAKLSLPDISLEPEEPRAAQEKPPPMPLEPKVAQDKPPMPVEPKVTQDKPPPMPVNMGREGFLE